MYKASHRKDKERPIVNHALRNPAFINGILLSVLFLSAFFNFYGLNWGLPSLWYPDEPETIESIILPMAINLDPNPHIFNKTSLYYYFLLLCLTPYLMFVKLGFIHNQNYDILVSQVTLIARMTTAMTGIFGVYLMYRLGKLLRDDWAGLISASLLACTLGYATYAHFAMMEILLLVFIILILYTTVRFFSYKQLKYYYLACLFSGLAVSTKFNAALLAVIVFLLLQYSLFRQKKTEEDSSIKLPYITPAFWKGIAVVLFGFFIGTPYALLDARTFLSFMVKQYNITKGFKVFVDGYQWIPYLKTLYAIFGPVFFTIITIVLILFILRSIKQPTLDRVLFIIPPIFYFTYVGSWKVYGFRYMLFMIPFLVMITTLVIYDSIIKLNSKWIKIGMLGLILIPTMIYCAAGISEFHNDTREQSSKWIESHLASDSHIEVYAYECYLPRISSKMHLKTLRPNFISKSIWYNKILKGSLGKFLILVDESNINDQVLAYSNLASFTIDSLQKRSPDYIILSDAFYPRYLRKNGIDAPYPQLSNYFEMLLDEKMGYHIIKRIKKEHSIMRLMNLNPEIIIFKRSDSD